jgi:Galactose oxidase, central domain
MSVLSPNLLYVYGGTGYYGSLSDLWSFDLISKAWTLIKLLPVEYISYGGQNLNIEMNNSEYLVLYGGYYWRGNSTEIYM